MLVSGAKNVSKNTIAEREERRINAERERKHFSIEIHQAEHAFERIKKILCAMSNRVYTRMNYKLSIKLVFALVVIASP